MSQTNASYLSLNALTRFKKPDGSYHFDSDKEAVRRYLEEHVSPNQMAFNSLEDKLAYLINEGYYEQAIFDAYPSDLIKEAFHYAYQQGYRFLNLMGAMKFYQSYALKTLDGKQYLETFEDRAVMNALFLADGDQTFVFDVIDAILHRRFQPATPTFLNAGKNAVANTFRAIFFVSKTIWNLSLAPLAPACNSQKEEAESLCASPTSEKSEHR